MRLKYGPSRDAIFHNARVLMKAYGLDARAAFRKALSLDVPKPPKPSPKTSTKTQ